MSPIARRTVLVALAGGAVGARAGLVDLMRSVRPSIVAVGNYLALRSPRFQFHGTGFVVGDGLHIVTNAHVLRGPRPAEALPDPAEQLAVLPAGRSERDWRLASVVAREPALDLALLRIEGEPLPALELGDSGAVLAGQDVALVGYPVAGALGLEPAIHRGIVAVVTSIADPSANSGMLDARRVAQLRRGSFQIFQLDATAYPGNSGSPLLDAASGRVIGVVNSVLVKGTKESALSQPTGITYAIPARLVDDLLQQHLRPQR